MLRPITDYWIDSTAANNMTATYVDSYNVAVNVSLWYTGRPTMPSELHMLVTGSTSAVHDWWPYNNGAITNKILCM